MSLLDQPWFKNIRRPSRYIGNEINSIKKDPASIDVSIALAFPDIYDIGMSHLGLKILYHILNSHNWLAAERVFSPWVDMETELRRRKIPLATLETNSPLSLFDIVGFSLQHELSYTNVLSMLDLAGIPFLSKDRGDEFPLIIAGGPACFNPEPVADIFDVMVIGDGEEAALKICRSVREAKQNKINRTELLSQLCRIPGVYIPSYFHVQYSPEGTVDTIEPLVSGYHYVEKTILPNIDSYSWPDHQIIPFTELVHDRVAIEIARGCTRGCRFCQAGMIYRPVRERNPESILKKIEETLKHTGYEEASLLSLSSGDYSCIEPLLKALMDRLAGENIALSLPSLRIDSLSPLLVNEIKRVRKTGFTLAPEAGNDRLRKIINKGLTQEDILETARVVYDAGWNLMKLYFMIGLPFEEKGDILDIIDLARQILDLADKKGRKARLNISISTFVPKSHTPFMWIPQIPLEESRRKIKFIREGLKGSRVRVKWNQPELSWLEGIFSRGDRRLNKVLIEAWNQGARFDAWSEHFKFGLWEEALSRSGLDPCFYLLRERTLDEVLPWDHIKSGVTKHFFRNEWKKAQQEKLTPDCREKCLECGVCNHKTVDPVLFKNWKFSSINQVPPKKPSVDKPEKYRLTFSKLSHARYLGHLELARIFMRAFRRAGLKLVYSKGFHPMPKISFAAALPLGTESIHETVDIKLREFLENSLLRHRVNIQLPRYISVISVKKIPYKRKKNQLKETHFLITIRGLKLKEEDIETFLRSDYFPVVKIKKKEAHEINARPLVKSMSLISDDVIKLAIQHTQGPELRPEEIVKAAFSLNDSFTGNIDILKTRQIF